MSLEKALTLFARCVNSQDYEPFRRIISEKAVYESHNHLYTLTGPERILEFLSERARQNRDCQPDRRVLAYTGFYLPREYILRPMYQPCVLIARGDGRNVETLYAMRMHMGKVTSITGLTPEGLEYTRGAMPQ